ncbi:hypothetical protein LTR17_026951 [Elasticomyces elasticus]|nr:hypothetical protein LTR17_026951 [Elasticomyces elasticus]
MADTVSFEGTAAWVQGQWSNPSDIFTILLIIGGDIVQAAIAQLCAGPVPYLSPVSFSFGWVSYAISAMRSAMGDNRLMPKPELECKLINAESGYSRNNHSWVLSRMLRDFDFWRPRECDERKAEKLAELRVNNQKQQAQITRELAEATNNEAKHKIQKRLNQLPNTEDIRVALRVSVWDCDAATGQGSGDLVYWSGILISALQLGIAALPWGLYDEWYTFLVTGAGTVLAYTSAALPQWREEKIIVRRVKSPKGVFLTEGNGADDVVLIRCSKGVLDLEALAAPQRDLRSPWTTRILSTIIAFLWVAFLVSVAGWRQHTWYLLGVGIIGILHNVGVAGMKRQPAAWGVNLQYKQTIVDGNVMEVLRKTEQSYPRAGRSLIAEFFPGTLFSREKRLWNYADQRYKAWKRNGFSVFEDGTANAWDMPPLWRPRGRNDDGDIPEVGEYFVGDRLSDPDQDQSEDRNGTVFKEHTSGDAVIVIDSSG